MGNWWLAASSQQRICSCITSRAELLVKHQITQVTQPCYSPDLVPCDFWLFPKLKSPLTRKRFQTVYEIQENTIRQLVAIRRIMWGPNVPTLKGTEASLSHVQCFLYLISSSINVSIFLSVWLDTLWTDYTHIYIYIQIHTHTHTQRPQALFHHLLSDMTDSEPDIWGKTPKPQ